MPGSDKGIESVCFRQADLEVIYSPVREKFRQEMCLQPLFRMWILAFLRELPFDLETLSKRVKMGPM